MHIHANVLLLREGLLLIECKQIYMNGVREHFRQYYNFMDFSVIALYLASYALRFATYYRVTEAGLYFNATARLHRAVNDCDRRQVEQLIRETTDEHNYTYGYFMAARTSRYSHAGRGLKGSLPRKSSI